MAKQPPFLGVGARFTRVGMFHKDFEVVEVYERHGHLPHARLRSIDDAQESVTVAVSVLLDRNLYKPAAAPVPPRPTVRDELLLTREAGTAAYGTPVPDAAARGRKGRGLLGLFGRKLMGPSPA